MLTRALASTVLLAAVFARGDTSACGREVAEWAGQCTVTTKQIIEPRTCLEQRAVLAVGPSGATLTIDVSAQAEGALKAVGSLGVSPVGSFPDWQSEPAERQAAFAAIASCLERDGSLLERSAHDVSAAAALVVQAPPRQPAAPVSRTPIAVLLVVALAVLLGALWLRHAARLSHALNAVQRRWHAGVGSLVVFLGLVAAVEAWASHAQDPDFWMPDPFHPFVVALAVGYVVAGFVPHATTRRSLQVLIFAAPLLVLAIEVRLAAADEEMASNRLVVSDDRLLRYGYRPGAIVRDRGGELTITADGLWDQPHLVPKPAGVRRVVVLGDSVPNDASIAFGERFPRVLEALLAAKAPGGERVEVINVSCEGYNTLQEVRLVEKVGLRYEPDLIVVAYVLNDPFLQNGAYRRLGNSFFAFKLGAALSQRASGGACSQFAKLHTGYQFDLVVRSSFERLRLLAEPRHIGVVVATIPIVERFDDPTCLSLYDQVGAVAREQGFGFVRLVDAFAGLDANQFLKPDARTDVTHPNAAGHARIAASLAQAVGPLLWPAR